MKTAKLCISLFLCVFTLPLVAIAATGGPDTFGYTWIDSDEPGGPTYNWVDITGVGTPVPFPPYRDDGNVGPIPIGFSFPFYGNNFTELYASTNGWFSFTNSTLTTFTNQPLPNAGASVPENLLAVWWDDMVYDESDGNEAFYYFDGSRFIVEYYVRRIAAFSPPFYRFQVILYPNGTFVYQYHTLGTTLSSSTIGIQNASKDDGLTVNHNDGAYPKEELAILFSPVIEIDIDIKFCSDPNAFNCKKKGVLPVTIFGTEAFDVQDIDPSTLRLCLEDLTICTDAPVGFSVADRGTAPDDLGTDQCVIVEDPPSSGIYVEQATADGFADMDVAFESVEVKAMLYGEGLNPGDFCEEGSKGDVSEAMVIMGETTEGLPFVSIPLDDVGVDQLLRANK